MLGLFLSAFAASTILPMQSEAMLVSLLLTDAYPVFALVAVASFGNVLGSMTNWLLGRGTEHFRDRRWFPVKPAALERAQDRYRRFGKWSLLLSWAPIIGDPLTIVAGVMREPLPTVLAIVTFAKVARYLVLTSVTLSVA